jgi:hypothetical protein
VVDDGDLIRMPHGAEAVGDDNGGPPLLLGQPVQSRLNHTLRLVVQRRGRLVCRQQVTGPRSVLSYGAQPSSGWDGEKIIVMWI